MESTKPSSHCVILSKQMDPHGQIGYLQDKLLFYQQELQKQPDNFDALLESGVINIRIGRYEDALIYLNKAAAIQSDNFDINYNIGVAFHGLGRFDESLAKFNNAILIEPENANVHYNRGIILKELKRYDDALHSFDTAITLRHDFAEAYYDRGNVLGNLGRFRDATDSYDQAISLDPNYAEAFYKKGLALQHDNHFNNALECYEAAISLNYNDAHIYNNRGILLQQLKHYDDALISYNQAILLKPDFAQAYHNRGVVQQHLKHYEDALTSYDKAISLNLVNPETFNNRAIILHSLAQYEAALSSYDHAISLNSDYANAYYNKGITLKKLSRHEEALHILDKAISLDPNIPYVYGDRLDSMMHIGYWEHYEQYVNEIIDRIGHKILPSQPFNLLSIPTTPSILQQCASHYVADKSLPSYLSHFVGKNYDHDRIRIGYFSADFHSHAVANLIIELYERHDRSRFEIFAFSFDSTPPDNMRSRLINAFDEFFDVSRDTDQTIVALAKKMEIDIAVDLMGFTDNLRLGIFGLRPAPIQVSYIGFPGTMGSHFFDYIIADKVVIPNEHVKYYSEKVVYLPHSYQVNSHRRIADTPLSRRMLGLPENGFVFCCFNKTSKITPDLFTIWMRLLSMVNDSVLWLFESNETIQRNLRKEAQQKKVDPNRLVFAPHKSFEEYLASHRYADLFLDTFYYNAHATASSALWAGLPVLTCLGNTFAGRVGASLLYAVGLSDLVTHSHEEYESLALSIATNPNIHSGFKNRLAQNRLSYPLFDIGLFTKHLETSYEIMWQRHNEGKPPDHIHVAH